MHSDFNGSERERIMYKKLSNDCQVIRSCQEFCFSEPSQKGNSDELKEINTNESKKV